ncbi:MAG: cysteine desulfurase [Ignavibacteriales bacterium]|nr:cysteine desulfurase [Ignavibacteriales bacterium]
MKRIYLDHSATTPLDPLVLEAMVPYFQGIFGNASSVHSFGREARAVLEESRERIARVIGARNDEVFFTSGGTEADNYAVKGIARSGARRGRNRIIVSAIEHHAVIHAAESLRAEGIQVEILSVDQYGMVDPEELRSKLSDQTALVSVMHANNEIGTIQPLREVVEVTKSVGAVVHSDTVQTAGKLPLRFREMGVDLLALSAHKFYGPKGIGAIVIRKGTLIDPLIVGGSQESNRRAGTESVALAVGFATALELSQNVMDQESHRMGELRGKLTRDLLSSFPGLLINGHPQQVLAHILSISFDSVTYPLDGDALIMGMDLRGVAVTSGSACTSGSLQPSHVLRAMGRDEKTAKSTIRFSLGRGTTEEDINYAASALKEVVNMVNSRS